LISVPPPDALFSGTALKCIVIEIIAEVIGSIAAM